MCKNFGNKSKKFYRKVKKLQKIRQNLVASPLRVDKFCKNFRRNFFGSYRGSNPDRNSPNNLDAVSVGAWCSLVLVT